MNTHIVTKPLPRGEVTLDVGTEVDASDWKHTRQLEEQRYITPLPPGEQKTKAEKRSNN